MVACCICGDAVPQALRSPLLAHAPIFCLQTKASARPKQQATGAAELVAVVDAHPFPLPAMGSMHLTARPGRKE